VLAPEVIYSLELLAKGLELERSHHFINMQGRQKRFDYFVLSQLKPLVKELLGEESLPRLLLQFQRYDMMALPQRMEAVHQLETLIQSCLNPAQPKQVQASSDEETPVALRPVQVVKGVGETLAKKLNTLNIYNVEQLLRYAPRQYIDYRQRRKLADLMEGEHVSIIATIKRVESHELKNRKLHTLRFVLMDDSGKATVQRFFSTKQRAMLESIKAKFPKETEVLATGKVKWDSFNRCPMLDNCELQPLSFANTEADPTNSTTGDPLPASHILPVYPLTQGMHLKTLRRCIQNALEAFAPELNDVLPNELREAHHLLPLHAALEQLHFPTSLEAAEQARHRLGFEELFMLQLRLALLKYRYRHDIQGQCFTQQPNGLVDTFTEALPYQLTNAQKRSFEEIKADVASPLPMNRLLHGDVGSGKTVVAVLTLLLAVENGYQGAMMAPTEILAEQHYKGLVEWLTPLGIKVGLLVGKQRAKAKREMLQSIANGQVHVAVGTHALIQETVEFHRLGIVVVDEQHRFGVNQRLALRNKGPDETMPELLSMTATPIPRTMAMTLHGDMDVSVLDELPPGRSPIITRLMSQRQRDDAYQLIETQLTYGRQAYIVFPLVDESESLAARAATAEFERLSTEVFPHRRVGLMHGKLASDEKEATMHAFATGELDILVSTTVIEVGVNVPNATVMLIENAERFGLAQLHQLRGRVGRGEHQSFCMLMPGKTTEDTAKRLGILEETGNGFVIAEHDLALRGPGEYVGLKQSGLPELQFASLIDDYTLLNEAREAAFGLFERLGIDEFKHCHPELWNAIVGKSAEDLRLLSSG
jgi:ATP-dependent DNA helicase RecG